MNFVRRILNWMLGPTQTRELDDVDEWVIIIRHPTEKDGPHTVLRYTGPRAEASDRAGAVMAAQVFQTGTPQYGEYLVISAREFDAFVETDERFVSGQARLANNGKPGANKN